MALLFGETAETGTCPQNLRPIALQEPVGKCVLGLVSQLAQKQAFQALSFWPLLAYLPKRSVLDCVMRVSQHCKDVRALLQSQKGGPHLRASHNPRFQVCGGVQLFVDLSRAFDMVNRWKLFRRLDELGVTADLIQILCTWHESSRYHVRHDNGTTPILTGRGVRQGCKGAPFLFNCFVHEGSVKGTSS